MADAADEKNKEHIKRNTFAFSWTFLFKISLLGDLLRRDSVHL